VNGTNQEVVIKDHLNGFHTPEGKGSNVPAKVMHLTGLCSDSVHINPAERNQGRMIIMAVDCYSNHNHTCLVRTINEFSNYGSLEVKNV